MSRIADIRQGPDPRGALSIIERLGLYRTIFDDPTQNLHYQPDLEAFSISYNALAVLVCPSAHNDATEAIARLLLRNDEDRYMMWILSAIIPWADAPVLDSLKQGSSKPVLAAVCVAREGIKVPNKICEVVGASIKNLSDITTVKNNFISQHDSSGKSAVVHEDFKSREYLGVAVRRWGSSWRSQLTFAMAHDMSHSSKTVEGKYFSLH